MVGKSNKRAHSFLIIIARLAKKKYFDDDNEVTFACERSWKWCQFGSSQVLVDSFTPVQMSNVRCEKCGELSNFSGKILLRHQLWRRLKKCCSCFQIIIFCICKAYLHILLAFESGIRLSLLKRSPSFLCIFSHNIMWENHYCRPTYRKAKQTRSISSDHLDIFIATSDILLPVYS